MITKPFTLAAAIILTSIFIFSQPTQARAGATPPPPFELCQQAGDFQDACEGCVGTHDAPTGKAWTAFGCIDYQSTPSLAKSLVTFGIGIAGGLAALLMLLGAFFITTSRSNPEKLKLGQDIFSGAITGLVFIIFAVVILNLIGVQILRIPGF